jgi:hypothetical protein
MDPGRPPGWYAPPGDATAREPELCDATTDGVQCEREKDHDGFHRAQIEWR